MQKAQQRRIAIFFVILLGIFVLSKPAFAGWLPDSNDIANLIASVGTLFASFIAGLIAVVIEYLTPVMLYNNFTNAPVVSAGWALVRDTVNMFFVIILIIIAFGTIFGHSKFKWQTQVPRLLIFAIVINFSKTLTGIMIDFGQVVMLTFANALAEIGPGNIIELFGLAKVSSFTSSSAAFSNTAGTGVEAWNLALASIAAIFILAWVLVIMLLMFGILLYRIVMLWILIVIAPLAWFTGAAGDIMTVEGYKEWWTNFKCMVAIGPVLTFFLWLALAVAGAGTTAEGFDTGVVDLGNSASFLTSIFELQNFMSLVIGSAMIFAGLDTAQKICSGIKGKFIGTQLGKAAAAGPAMAGVMAGAATKTAAWTGRQVGAGARAVGRAGARYGGAFAENKPGLRLLTRRGRAQAWQKVAGAAGTGVVGRTLGVAAERKAQALRQPRIEEIAKAGEKYKTDTKATKLKQLERFAKSGHLTLGGKQEAQALFKETLGDADMQKELVKTGALQQLWGRYGKSMEEDFTGDAKTIEQLDKFKKKYAHLTGSSDLIKTKDDVASLDSGALLNEDVRKKLGGVDVKVDVVEEEEVTGADGKKKRVKKKVEKSMSAAEAIEQGHFGDEKKKVWQERFTAVKDEDLRGILPRDAAATGGDAVQRVASLAIKDGDIARATSVMTSAFAAFTAAPKDGQTLAQKDEERFHLATALDKVQTQLRQVITDGQAQKKSMVEQQRLLEDVSSRRKLVEDLAVPPQSAPLGVTGKYGKVPRLSKEKSARDFVQENFADASEGRLRDAKAQLDSRPKGSRELDEINSQIRNLERDLSSESSGQARMDVISDIRKKITDLEQRKEQEEKEIDKILEASVLLDNMIETKFSKSKPQPTKKEEPEEEPTKKT